MGAVYEIDIQAEVIGADASAEQVNALAASLDAAARVATPFDGAIAAASSQLENAAAASANAAKELAKADTAFGRLEREATRSAKAVEKAAAAGRDTTKLAAAAKAAAAAVTTQAAAVDKAAAAAKTASAAEKQLASSLRSLESAAKGSGKAVGGVTSASAAATGGVSQVGAAFKTFSDAKSGSVGPLGAALAKLGPIGWVVAAAILAVGAAVAGVIALAKATVQAAIATEGLLKALRQTEGAASSRTLALLRDDARDLGIEIDGAVKAFGELRQAGLKVDQARAVLRLKADLDAAGVSADAAKEAITRATEAIKKGEDATRIVAKIAREFGALGAAATARTDTLGGAINSASGFIDRLWAAAIEQAAPALRALAQAITQVFDRLEKGGESKAIIDALVGAIKLAAAAAKVLLIVIEALAGAFSKLSTLGRPLAADLTRIGSAMSMVTGATGGAIASFAGFTASMERTTTGLRGLDAGLRPLRAAFSAAGTSAGEGFVQGLLGKIDAARAASSMLGAASESGLRGALGMHSPSRAMMAAGADAGAGFAGGIAGSVGGVSSAVERMATSAVSATAGGGTTNTASRGGDTYSIVIHAPSGDGEDILAAFRRWFTDELDAEAVSLGLSEAPT